MQFNRSSSFKDDDDDFIEKYECKRAERTNEQLYINVNALFVCPLINLCAESRLFGLFNVLIAP